MADKVNTELERERRISNAFLELEDKRIEVTELRQQFASLKHLYQRIIMTVGTVKIPKKLLDDLNVKGTIKREDDPNTGDIILTFKKVNGDGNGRKS